MFHNGTVTRLRGAWLFFALCVVSPAQRFVILGDRTGSVQKGVYEQVWREVAAEKPEFVLTTGDLIEGLVDRDAEAQWDEVERIHGPHKAIPLFLTPGNHDIWSAVAEQLFRKRTGRAPHYSFDRGAAHFTVLDNSRSDEFTEAELAFLEADLKAHSARPVKFIMSHRPSWILQAALKNATFPLHRLARQYGVKYVLAGHIHQLLRLELEGIEYVSMPSAGGHLRASGAYKDGWFFGYTVVVVKDGGAEFTVHELKAPHGQGRVTALRDWGMVGLTPGR
ncbi:MAG: metallophosphoesterase [Thermomicrobiales bacterium]|jgi:3',5'-cyclic AMP phosphodiesterase CpdA|nr:metallophosphoesterase [Thermomicrobiales bacterium]